MTLLLRLLAAALLLLLLLLLAGTKVKVADDAFQSADGCTPADRSFDVFELVVQWPPGYGTDVGRHLDVWTLHGLWPSRANASTYPCTCTNEAFRPDSVASIRTQLDKYWPSLASTDNTAFWAHEWEKHGTCSAPFLTKQLDYFAATLRFRQNLDPAALLAGAGIRPSATQPISYGALSRALGVHGVASLHCHGSGSNRQVLFEVVFCLNAARDAQQEPCTGRIIHTTSSPCNPDFGVFLLPPSTPNAPLAKHDLLRSSSS